MRGAGVFEVEVLLFLNSEQYVPHLLSDFILPSRFSSSQ